MAEGEEMSPTNGKRLVCAVAAVVGLVLIITAFFVNHDAIVLVELGLICSAMAALGFPWSDNSNRSLDILPASRLHIPMPPVKPPRVVVLYDPKNGNPCPACKFKGSYLEIPCEAHRTEGKL
jgi:hypothetical protein